VHVERVSGIRCTIHECCHVLILGDFEWGCAYWWVLVDTVG